MTDILGFDYRSGSAEDFARALFDRPIAVANDETERSTDDWFDPRFGDKAGFLTLCTRLFERFGELSAPYSIAQIDQGLWYIHGDPYFLPDYLTGEEDVPVKDAIACVEASYHLYADYMSLRAPNGHAGALYMWWDEGWNGATTAFLDAVLATLERILKLSDTASRRVALHGLAHFKEDWDRGAAQAAINDFISREGSTLSDDDIAYAEFCRDQSHI